MTNPTKSTLHFFAHFVANHKFKFASLFLTATVWAFTTSLFPYLIKIIVDNIVSFKGDPKDVYIVVASPAITYIVLRISLSLFMRVENIVETYTLPTVKAEIRNFMFERITGHSYEFFQQHMSGNISNKVLNMAQSFEKIYRAIHDAIFSCIISFMISTFLMWQCVPKFAMFFVIWFVSALVITSLLCTRSIILSNKRAEAESAVAGAVVDVFRNIITVLTFFQFKTEKKHLDIVQNNEVDRAVTLEWELIKIHIFRSISTTIMLIFMLVMLVEGWKGGWVTIGDFTFVSSTSFSMAHLVWWSSKEFTTLYKEWGIAQQAFSLLKLPYTNQDKPGAKPIKIDNGIIKFENVTFKYQDGNEVFENISVTINAGEKIGLVGLSGSGKTTFVKLLLRFFKPQSGSISIDNQNLNNVAKESLRHSVDMIPQSPGLFNRTIAENILYGRPGATHEEVVDAAKKAECEDFIFDMPSGYQASVGEGGDRLSGGQRQRLAIARAILKDAPILILDEATSALDSATEQKIQKSFDYLMKDRTTIVIAHRLSTLLHMDRILVFDKGKIIEEGSHEQLLKQNGHYATLWNMQAHGFIAEN